MNIPNYPTIPNPRHGVRKITFTLR